MKKNEQIEYIFDYFESNYCNCLKKFLLRSNIFNQLIIHVINDCY